MRELEDNSGSNVKHAGNMQVLRGLKTVITCGHRAEVISSIIIEM